MFAKLLLALSLAAAAQAISLMPAASLSCSNGLFCAMGETCMSNEQGAGAKLACSPFPNAVVCNDRRHSCPSGSTCFNELCTPANTGKPFKASMAKDAVSVGLRTYGQGIYIHPNDAPGSVNNIGSDICNMFAPNLANFCLCNGSSSYASVTCQANIGNYITTFVGVKVVLSSGIDFMYSYGPGAVPGMNGLTYGMLPRGPTTQSFPIVGASIKFLGIGISTTADFSVKYNNSVSLDVSVGACVQYGTVPGLNSSIPSSVCSYQPAGQNLLGFANISGAHPPHHSPQLVSS
jgi:hypothetical protein